MFTQQNYSIAYLHYDVEISEEDPCRLETEAYNYINNGHSVPQP